MPDAAGHARRAGSTAPARGRDPAALLGIATATPPVIASQPSGSLKALVYGAFFTVHWLLSATLFRAAAKKAKPAAVLPQPMAPAKELFRPA